MPISAMASARTVCENTIPRNTGRILIPKCERRPPSVHTPCPFLGLMDYRNLSSLKGLAAFWITA
jgi:hypothetical protein